MKKNKNPRISTIAIAIASFVVLISLVSEGRAGENAPKDAFIGGSSHPYYGRDHGGCTTTPTMNYAVHITFMSTD